MKRKQSKNISLFIVLFLTVIPLVLSSVCSAADPSDKTLSTYDIVSTLKDVFGITSEGNKNNSTDGTLNSEPSSPTKDSSSEKPDAYSQTPAVDDSKQGYQVIPPTTVEIQYSTALTVAEKTLVAPVQLSSSVTEETLTLSLGSYDEESLQVSALGHTYTVTEGTVDITLPSAVADLPYVLVYITQNGITTARYVPV